MRARTIVLFTALTGCLFPEAQLEEEKSALIPEGVYLWLKADVGAIADESGLVSQWTDHSGSGRHATEGNAAFQPTKRDAAFGDLPAIHFDGSDDALNFPPGFDRVCDGFTFFAVVQPDASSTDTPRSMFYIGNGVETDDIAVMGYQDDYLVEVFDRQARVPSYMENTAAIVHAVMRSNAQTLGISVTPGDEYEEVGVVPPVCTARTVNFVGHDDYDLHGVYSGLLAEILFYDRALTPTEIAEVNKYLSGKWSCCSP